MKKIFSESSFYKERRDEVYLEDSIFGEGCCQELREIDKHEIIVKISEILGSDPCNLCLAEDILNELKFDIARYVIHHEYSKESNGIKSKLLLWLESKTNPEKAKKLTSFMNKYIKNK